MKDGVCHGIKNGEFTRLSNSQWQQKINDEQLAMAAMAQAM